MDREQRQPPSEPGPSGAPCSALRLQDGGLAATVYEANTRVGGRLYSNMAGNYWDAGQVTEWGGELVDTDHQVIQTLAKRFSLTLDDLRAAEPNGDVSR